MERNRTERKVTFKIGALQLLSDTIIMVNDKQSNGNRRPIQYDSRNATITIRYNGNIA